MRKCSSPEQNHRVSSPQCYHVLQPFFRLRTVLLSFKLDGYIPSFLPLTENKTVEAVTQSKTVGPIKGHRLSFEGYVRCDLIT